MCGLSDLNNCIFSSSPVAKGDGDTGSLQSLQEAERAQSPAARNQTVGRVDQQVSVLVSDVYECMEGKFVKCVGVEGTMCGSDLM